MWKVFFGKFQMGFYTDYTYNGLAGHPDSALVALPHICSCFWSLCCVCFNPLFCCSNSMDCSRLSEFKLLVLFPYSNVAIWSGSHSSCGEVAHCWNNMSRNSKLLKNCKGNRNPVSGLWIFSQTQFHSCHRWSLTWQRTGLSGGDGMSKDLSPFSLVMCTYIN